MHASRSSSRSTSRPVKPLRLALPARARPTIRSERATEPLFSAVVHGQMQPEVGRVRAPCAQGSGVGGPDRAPHCARRNHMNTTTGCPGRRGINGARRGVDRTSWRRASRGRPAAVRSARAHLCGLRIVAGSSDRRRLVQRASAPHPLITPVPRSLNRSTLCSGARSDKARLKFCSAWSSRRQWAC